MQTKTYFASSVPAALEVARKELGGEALLVNSKPAPAAARPFGRLEVTFAYEARATSKAPEPEITSFGAGRSRATGGERKPASEMDEIRQQLSALRVAMGRAGQDFHDSHRLPEGNLYGEGCLCEAGIGPETAREIARAAEQRQGDRHGALVQEVTSRISHAPFEEMKPGENRTLAFIGPSGRGKTTTLVKLAVRYGIAQRIPVRIYSAGAHGVGCQEQMARYATILGVPFQACESLESLNLTLNGEAWKGLALIDTPGISPADGGGISELAGFFSRRREIEKHLVLRADAQSADMSHVVSRFSGIEPSRLLFTGLDEALSVGAMVDTLIRTGMPGAFVGTGQEIPDDLEEMDVAKLARLICGRETRGKNALAAMAA